MGTNSTHYVLIPNEWEQIQPESIEKSLKQQQKCSPKIFKPICIYFRGFSEFSSDIYKINKTKKIYSFRRFNTFLEIKNST